MKRKILALLLAALMLLALAACGQEASVQSPDPSDAGQSMRDENKSKNDKIKDETKKPVKDPSETAGPADDGQEQSGQDIQQNEGNGEAHESEDDAGGHADLAAFTAGLPEKYEISGFLQRQDPDDETGQAMIGSYFPGLLDLDLEQIEIYLCMISFNSGEFSAVQAKSEADAKIVKEIFQARIDGMLEEGANYPETVRQWQDNAKVVMHGSYVLLVCAEDCDAIAADFEALF